MAEALDRVGEAQRERLLRILSAATFLIFFQAYMVAPLIPRLANVFAVSGQTIGLIVPAYMIPYGVSTLFYGLLSDLLGAVVLGMLWPSQHLLGEAPPATSGTLRDLFAAYGSLLGPGRGRRTYAYVLLNAVFHSGVFTWLGLYFERRYGLGEVGIGLALLGYGVPGFLLGPPIGRAADRWGRRWLVPTGLGIAALAAGILIWDVPLVVAAVAVTLLSLGYDMTQPLLAGIVTALGGQRAGQAMGLNVFMLFTGFGLGSLLFGAALPLGFGAALALFSSVQLGAALLALPLFRSETVQYAPGGPPQPA